MGLFNHCAYSVVANIATDDNELSVLVHHFLSLRSLCLYVLYSRWGCELALTTADLDRITGHFACIFVFVGVFHNFALYGHIVPYLNGFRNDGTISIVIICLRMVSYTRYEMFFVTPSCQRICHQLKRLAKVLLCFDMRKSLRIFFLELCFLFGCYRLRVTRK